LATVLSRKDDLLYVASTGSGKSLLSFLPSFIENQQESKMTTIVISPFVALLNDMIVRAKALGMSADTWGGKSIKYIIFFIHKLIKLFYLRL
jgi:superfamily II DNA helicase RecQ